jgi:predicted RNase H-like HicB family nuclease
VLSLGRLTSSENSYFCHGLLSARIDEEGYYVASVPQLPGCHTQARSLDEVTQRIRKAIQLCFELTGAPEQTLEFVGIQRITVAACAGFRSRS